MRFSWKIKINKTRIIVWQVKTSYDIENHIIKRQTVFWVKASLYDTFAQSHRHKASALLRCLNTVCARCTICTADMNKRVHKALRKTNMEPVHLSFYFVQWRLCNCFFSVLTVKQFVMCQKRLFFNVYWKTPCLSGIVCMDRERSRILSNAAHVQLTRKLWLHDLVEMHWFLWSRSLEFHEIW